MFADKVELCSCLRYMEDNLERAFCATNNFSGHMTRFVLDNTQQMFFVFTESKCRVFSHFMHSEIFQNLHAHMVRKCQHRC